MRLASSVCTMPQYDEINGIGLLTVRALILNQGFIIDSLKAKPTMESYPGIEQPRPHLQQGPQYILVAATTHFWIRDVLHPSSLRPLIGRGVSVTLLMCPNPSAWVTGDARDPSIWDRYIGLTDR